MAILWALFLLRAALIVWAFMKPFVRLRQALQLAMPEHKKTVQLLKDYLLMCAVVSLNEVGLVILVLLPTFLSTQITESGWYTPVIMAIWFSGVLPFVYAGNRLGRVLED